MQENHQDLTTGDRQLGCRFNFKMSIIEKIFAMFGFYRNPILGSARGLTELETMKACAEIVESRGYRVFNYAPGLTSSDDHEFNNAVEFIGKRGYITVQNNTVFGVMSPVFQSSEEVAHQRRSNFRLISSGESEDTR